jgi:hypothetical protein
MGCTASKAEASGSEESAIKKENGENEEIGKIAKNCPTCGQIVFAEPGPNELVWGSK